MGRRKKKRFVQGMPEAVFFKPQGIPMRALSRQAISIEGFEAIRLVDCEGLMQQEAADKMGVSRPTLSRILSEARKGVAMALTNGWAIEIEGGAYHIADDEPKWECPKEQGDKTMPGMDGTGPRAGGRGQGQGQGRGMGRGQGMGRGTGAGKGQCARQGQSPATTTTNVSKTDTSAIKKVAVTSEGPSLEDRVDPRFGRAAGFVIVDLESMVTEYVDNGSSQVMNQGAGIQAAENVANANAQIVLSGYVGPKAFTALTAAGIQIGQDVDGMTVREAVEKFKAGDVPVASQANAQQGSNK